MLCTIGPLITDNSLALAPVINAAGVPAVTWTGTDRYFGEYCFNLGNGGLAEEAAIMATWIRRSGYRTVGMIHEISPGGVEYASNFRWYAAREKLDILIEAYTTQIPDDLEAMLRKIRDQRPDCLAYLGYGYPTILMAPDVRAPRLGPAAHHDHGVPVLLREARVDGGARGLVRHRSDVRGQPAPAARCSTASPARIGKRRDHTVTALSYDTARLIAEGIARANLLTPKGVKEGLEKVRMLPAVNGGPRTHMSLGPVRSQGIQGRLAVIRGSRADDRVRELYEP